MSNKNELNRDLFASILEIASDKLGIWCKFTHVREYESAHFGSIHGYINNYANKYGDKSDG